MKRLSKTSAAVFLVVFAWFAEHRASACIWDADTMISEKFKSPDMAKAILKGPPKPPDPKPLLKRIEALTASPKKEDPAWWNELAGAHLRLGRAQEAADLLAPVVAKFANDYGIHANLGTAYHLLGRYAEAEKEIARDLELNPGAHFGLEKYHLALLQYLMRDKEYQKKHVYVDEWSRPFSAGRLLYARADGKLDSSITNAYDEAAVKRLEESVVRLGRQKDPAGDAEVEKEIERIKSIGYSPPPYRFKWDLAKDPKFEEGILYMASLNPGEPACFVMLGVACAKNRRHNLAAAAFEKAITLNSPQYEKLKMLADASRKYVWKSHLNNLPVYLFGFVIIIAIAAYIRSQIALRRFRRVAE